MSAFNINFFSMSQTTVQNAKSVRLGSGVFKIGGVNIGLLKGAKVTADRSVVQFKADNGFLPPRAKLAKVKIEADLYEINLANFALIDGAGVASAVAGVSTPVTAEVLRAIGTWGTNEIIFPLFSNGDKTVVSSIVVKNGATTLALGTDYAVVVENGKTGIVRVGTALTLTGIGLNMGYTYTPNAKNIYTYSDIMKSITLAQATFENTDENGKKFTVRIPKGYNTANISFAFASDDKLDEAVTFPISFEAYPDENNQLLVIEDEQAA